MVQRNTMAAKPREVLGKKVKQLRRVGVLPGNVYGRGIESTPVQLDAREFLRIVKASGVRSMFDLSIEGEAKSRLVLIRGLERHGGMGEPTHVDFFQVDLQRPLVTSVPINLVGTAPAVKDMGGTLIYGAESVQVRCLPLDIPDVFEVDVSMLNSFDVSITVGDLEIPENVELLVDPAVNVATVNPPRLRLDAIGDDEEGAEGEGGEGSESGEDEGGEDGASE